MGTEREQPPGEVLHLDRCRASPPARRNSRLEPPSDCDCRGLEYHIGGGVTCSSVCVLCFVCSLGGVISKRECPRSSAFTSSNTRTTSCAPACHGIKRPA